jgi:D-glycero-D-manno-heptose 1,7-bisphosphate phosphatase
MNKAVFLDRDGTINEEMGYINHISRFKIFNYTFDAIRILNNLGFKIIVITNQSGLARGYFNEDLLIQLHQELLNQAEKNNAKIDAIYFCPHHKDGVIEKYKKDCDCRKPKPGMLIKARQEFNISLKESFMISDRYKDMQFAYNNHVKSIMVMTGYGLGEYTYQSENWSRKPDYICDNLLEAVNIIEKIETSVSN